MTVGERNDQQVDLLQSDFLLTNDKVNRWGNVLSSFQTIPGLVGFWPMSSVQRSTGNAYDISNQGRTLTYNGNPTYNIYQDFTSYINLDGTGDYLSRGDETDLDILGTETIYDSSIRGLTIGGWFYINGRVGTSEGYFTKWVSGLATDISYGLWEFAANAKITFSVGTGAAIFSVGSPSVVPLETWEFWVGRYTPSTEIAVYRNGEQKATLRVGIPASILNSGAPLSIGAIGAGNNLANIRASLCFLSANILSNSLINSLFQQSRILFGV